MPQPKHPPQKKNILSVECFQKWLHGVCRGLQHLGSILAHLGASWAHLGSLLGPSWEHLGPILEHLGASWGLLGPSLEHLGTRTQHAVTKTPPPKKNLKNVSVHLYIHWWVGGVKLRIKTISAQLKLRLGLSLAKM